jgi:beta-lactamase class A
MMEKTTTGPARIKGLLPAGTVVAHKTGTTGSAGNLNGSTNDVGVIAGRIALAVYVKGSTRPLAVRERAIAEIARTVVPA